MDAVKDNQIFQPNNATTVVTLVQQVGEEPVNVAVERVPQFGTLGATRVVDSFTYLSPCGLSFGLVQVS